MATVSFGRFSGSGEFASAPVFKDGVQVGTIHRIKSDEFVTESSRARKWVVSEYEVALEVDEDTKVFMVTRAICATGALKQAADYCRERLA